MTTEMTTTLDMILQTGLEITPEGFCTRHPDIRLCCTKENKPTISACDICNTEQKLEEDSETGGERGPLVSLSKLFSAFSNSPVMQEHQELGEGSEELLSRWCQLQDPTQKPTNGVVSTTLLLLQMQKLERRVQKQETDIQALQQGLLDQQSAIHGDLTKILSVVTDSAKQGPSSSSAGNESQHQNRNRQEIVVAPPISDGSPGNARDTSQEDTPEDTGSALRPSSVFTSVRTTETQPPKPPQRHDSLGSIDVRPSLKSTLSSRSSDFSSASSSVDKFVFHPPQVNPRPRGHGGMKPLYSRNSMRNNKAQQLEIIWDASEHTSNKLENSRADISCNPKDLFKSGTNNFNDSLMSGATKAYNNISNAGKNPGFHDSALTGVQSFMWEDDGDDDDMAEKKLLGDQDDHSDSTQEMDNSSKGKRRQGDLESGEGLKNSSGHSLSRGENRAFSKNKKSWSQGKQAKTKASPTIPKRVASIKKMNTDEIDERNLSKNGSDGIVGDIDIQVQQDSGHTEIPLNMSDYDNQIPNQNNSKGDITVQTPSAQGLPTEPPNIRRPSGFHPPSPPPRHRKFFPRSSGIMPTLINSKREILINQGGSSQVELSCLTLDTALPSSDAGSIVREVNNYPITDKCNERGTYTGTISENDAPDGYGTMTYDSGAFYRGGWKDGHWYDAVLICGAFVVLHIFADFFLPNRLFARHGSGFLRSPSGDSYEGTIARWPVLCRSTSSNGLHFLRYFYFDR